MAPKVEPAVAAAKGAARPAALVAATGRDGASLPTGRAAAPEGATVAPAVAKVPAQVPVVSTASKASAAVVVVGGAPLRSALPFRRKAPVLGRVDFWENVLRHVDGLIREAPRGAE